jgi:glycosyltransferase involved in cell wall biosynthesis
MCESCSPRISIVTPSYNQGSLLEETIQSVLNQNYPDLEYIVIDGGSTDKSTDVLRRYSRHLSYWESEKDRGQSHAINKGFKRTTGEIIAYLNSDDRYCPNTLHRIAAYFSGHPQCMWLCGNVLFTDAAGKVFARKRPIYTQFVLKHGTASLYQPSVFLRREVLREIGYLCEDFHAIMDREWFCRIADRYPPHILDEDLAFFRWSSGQKSSSPKGTAHYKRYIEERVIVSGKYAPALRPFLALLPTLALFVLEQIARTVKMWLRFKRLIRGAFTHGDDPGR